MKEDNKAPLQFRTKKFALRILRLFCALPKTSEAQVLGKQLLRSDTSIGANYREAMRARSPAEFLSKVGCCLQETEETSYWLELFIDGKIIPESQLSDLLKETHELTAMFVSSINTVKRKMQSVK